MVRTKAEAKRTKEKSKKSGVPVLDGGTKPARSKASDVRPYRRRPGKKAIMEIRKAQDCREKNATGPGIRGLKKAPFNRCAREIMRDASSSVTQISPKALATLQGAAEECLREHFALAMGITASRHGQMVTGVDLRFAHNILTNPHMLNEHSGTERMMTRASDGRYAHRKKHGGEPFAASAGKADKRSAVEDETDAKADAKTSKKTNRPKEVKSKKDQADESDEEFVDAE